MKTIIKTTLMLAIICLTTVSANALELLNPSDDFSGTSIDSTMWTICPNTSLNQAANYFTGNGGHAEIRTNFAFIGNFDAQITAVTHNAYSQYFYNAVYASFHFYKYPISPSENYTLDLYGSAWGFSGSNHGWFYPSDTSPGWYSVGGETTDYTSINTWIQYRIQRVDDDIYTYYRNLGNQDWTLQHTYLDFGTDPLILALHLGQSSGGSAFTGTIDNFITTGFATSDPATVPEPLSILCLSLSMIGLYKKLR